MEPLYQKISKELYYQIKNGTYAPGSVLPTEEELCRRYGVSRITAKHALNELKDQGLITRARKKGSVVLPLAESLFLSNVKFSRSLLSIPFVFSYFDNYDAKMLNGIVDYARDKNHIPFYNSNKSVEKEREILSVLLNEKIAGLVLFPVSRAYNADVLSEYLIKNIPVSFIDFRIDGIQAPCCSSNNTQGAYELVRYLIDNGHTRIAFYRYHETMNQTAAQRYSGYIQALIKSGIPVTENLIYRREDYTARSICNFEDVDRYEHECAELAVNQFLAASKRPTVIVCLNDHSASTLIDCLEKRGLNVPRDVGVTGFDNTDLSRRRGITTVAQNFDHLAYKALECIYLRRQHYVVDPDNQVNTIFVERSSVLPVSNMNLD